VEVPEAIHQRRSCRSFRPDPVPGEAVEAILSHAAAAPSAVNLQPWRVWVAGGEELARLKSDLVRSFRERRVGCSPTTGASRPPSPGGQKRGSGESQSDALGAGPGSFRGLGEILAARGEDLGRFINEGSCRLYGAPVGVFCFLEPGEPPIRLLDCGIWLGYFLLAAEAQGLATCPVGLLAAYADVVREALFVPESYQFACAVALGYRQEGEPLNEFACPRVGIQGVQWVF